MKIELIRTSDPDGMWYKIYQDGWPVKVWRVLEGNENLTHIEAEVYFDKLVKEAKKVEVIKTTII